MPSSPDASRASNVARAAAWAPADLSVMYFAGPADEAVNRCFAPAYQADLAQKDTLAFQVLEMAGVELAAQADEPVASAASPAQAFAWSPCEIEPIFPEEGRSAGLQEHPHSSPTRLEAALRQADEIEAQARTQADETVHAALAKADEILNRAEAEAAEITQQARSGAAEVTRRAHDQAVDAAHAETAALLQSASSVVEEVKAWRESMFAQSEMMMLRLVIEIAQTIFGEGLPLDPEVLGQAFSRALAEAKTLGDLRMYVHPDDAALLSPHWVKSQAAMSGQSLELVPSDIIKRGGCFVEGQFGSVDARVETQFELATTTLLNTLTVQGAVAL
jgi:flagellar assembly protein FliH